MTTTITVDIAHVQAALDNVARNIVDMTPVMRDIGDDIVMHIKENLGRGLDYRGSAFKPLSEKYMKQVPRRRGGIPLNDTRQHIYNNINSKESHDGVMIGMLDTGDKDSKIGRAHQYGRGLPRRPFLPIDTVGKADIPEDWQRSIIEAITAHIMPST